ncbi:hypothetical protein [Flavobacterium sp.]|jgi:hypothetical protein|uniref:hypothetical protein n=1 Tax=Flavobacterium sp. TaxID=239 RepID=UPI00391B0AA9
MKNNLKNGYILFLLFFISKTVFGQTDSLAIEKLRTESGVDPTRVNSRVGYSILYFDKADNASSISNKFNIVLGVNRWSFSIKPEIMTLHNGISGTGFETSFSDVKFSILNAFYVKGKNSVAGSVEFNLPFGKQGFGSQYFSATPAITYSYTINTTLFLAIQPQYSFAIAKDAIYPNLSFLTNRVFIAKFTNSGMFYVFEPRTIIDFENKNFDLILSPIIGKSLGAGFNLIGLMEIPTKKSTIDGRGILYQIGFNKNF